MQFGGESHLLFWDFLQWLNGKEFISMQESQEMQVEYLSWEDPLEEEMATSGSRHEDLRLWQRSWGRSLDIHKGGIEPQESPWKFSGIYPQNQSLSTFCFVLSPTPLTLRGAVPHYLSLKKKS